MSLLATVRDKLLCRKIVGLAIYEDARPEAVGLASKDDELKVEEQLSGFDEIASYLRQHRFVGIAVTFHSKLIVHVSGSKVVSEDNYTEIFHEHAPNGKPEDFLIDFNGFCISFARITAIDSLLEPFAEFKDRILGMYLAPTAGLALADYVRSSNDADSVTVDRFEYHFKQNQLMDIQRAVPVALDLGDHYIDAGNVGSFVSALNFFTRRGRETRGVDVVQNLDEFFYKMMFIRGRIPVLAVLLIGFLCNAFLFVQLDLKNQELKEKASYVRQLDSKLDGINQFVTRNESVLRASDVRFSLVADQLGYLTPSGISLSHLTINPPSETRGEQAYLKGRIVIAGEASSAAVFSQWLETLSKQDWLQEIEKQTFENQSRGSAKSSFQLILLCDVEKINL